MELAESMMSSAESRNRTLEMIRREGEGIIVVNDGTLRRRQQEGENGPSGDDEITEFPTWEACARVVSKERRDFYEFVVSLRSPRFR